MAHAQCLACDGLGQIECHTCGATGQVGGFLGVGAKMCVICEGEGKVPCVACGGLGSVRPEGARAAPPPPPRDPQASTRPIVLPEAADFEGGVSPDEHPTERAVPAGTDVSSHFGADATRPVTNRAPRPAFRNVHTRPIVGRDPSESEDRVRHEPAPPPDDELPTDVIPVGGSIRSPTGEGPGTVPDGLPSSAAPTEEWETEEEVPMPLPGQPAETLQLHAPVKKRPSPGAGPPTTLQLHAPPVKRIVADSVPLISPPASLRLPPEARSAPELGGAADPAHRSTTANPMMGAGTFSAVGEIGEEQTRPGTEPFREMAGPGAEPAAGPGEEEDTDLYDCDVEGTELYDDEATEVGVPPTLGPFGSGGQSPIAPSRPDLPRVADPVKPVPSLAGKEKDAGARRSRTEASGDERAEPDCPSEEPAPPPALPDDFHFPEAPEEWLTHAREVSGVPPKGPPGLPAGAADMLSEARSLYESVVAAGGQDYEPCLAMVTCLEAEARGAEGRPSEAAALHSVAAEKLSLLRVQGESGLENALARSLTALAIDAENAGDLQAAAVLHERVVEARRAQERLGEPAARRSLARALMNQAVVADQLGELSAARETYGAAASLWEALVAKGAKGLEDDLARACMNEGVALEALGNLAGAADRYGRAISLWEPLVSSGASPELAGDLGWTLAYRASVLDGDGRREEAKPLARQALSLLRDEVERTGREDLREVLGWAETELGSWAR